MSERAKHFAVKLNKSLDDLGMPADIRERTTFLSKMLHVQKPQARAMLEGLQIPDEELLQSLATELEVEAEWLLDDSL